MREISSYKKIRPLLPIWGKATVHMEALPPGFAQWRPSLSVTFFTLQAGDGSSEGPGAPDLEGRRKGWDTRE